jgi:hypothetical protein
MKKLKQQSWNRLVNGSCKLLLKLMPNAPADHV